MRLFTALMILAELHTRYDRETGYVVEMAPSLSLRHSRYTEAEYIEAWGVVRREAGMSHEPETTGNGE